MTLRFRPGDVPISGSAQFPTVPTNPTDHEGKSPMSTVFGEMQVGFKMDDVSLQFQYNNSTRDVTETISGTGVVGNSGSEANLNTGVGVGLASLTSRDAVRYRPGHEMIAMFTTHYDTPEVNVRMQHGLLNDADGVTFGFKDTDFGVYFLENSNETFTAQSAWNVDKLDGSGPSRHLLNPQALNIYKISLGWLGIAPIMFSVYAGYVKGWVLCHVIDLANVSATPHLKNPSLPVKAVVERTSGTGADLHLHTSSWRAGVVAGQAEKGASNRWFSTGATLVLANWTGTTYGHLFSIQSKGTYQGKVNHILSELGVASFATDATKNVEFVGIINGVLAGNTAFADIDTANSVMSVSTGGTVVGTTSGASTVLAKVEGRRADLLDTGITIHPGDIFSLGVRRAGGGAIVGEASGDFRWVEYF